MSATRDPLPGRRTARWILVGMALLAVAAVLSIGITQGWAPALAVAGLLAVVVIAGWAANRATRRRQRQEFAIRYDSLDDVRATLDLDDLSALRNARGDLAAVSEIRRRAPLISLEQAAEIMRGL